MKTKFSKPQIHPSAYILNVFAAKNDEKTEINAYICI